MGAVDFYNTFSFKPGKPVSYQDAYQELYDRAKHEHGHGGYTGTIAESAGVFLLPNPHGRPLTRFEADAIASRAIANGDVQKWEAAACLPLAVEDKSTAPQTRTVTVKIAGSCPQWLDLHDPDPSAQQVALMDAITKKLSVAPPAGNDAFAKALGAGRGQAQVRLSANRFVQSVEIDRASITTRTKVSAQATEGKAQTRYFVTVAGNHFGVRKPGNNAGQGYDTQALARAAAVQYAKDYTGPEELSLGVVAKVTRSGQDELVQIRREVISSEVTVKVTIGTRPSGPVKQGGWLFFGIASS